MMTFLVTEGRLLYFYLLVMEVDADACVLFKQTLVKIKLENGRGGRIVGLRLELGWGGRLIVHPSKDIVTLPPDSAEDIVTLSPDTGEDIVVLPPDTGKDAIALPPESGNVIAPPPCLHVDLSPPPCSCRSALDNVYY